MKRTWTEEKKEYLRKNYATTTFSIMEKVLGTTEGNIRAQAKRLGLRRATKKEKDERLTEEEIKDGRHFICWWCAFAANKYIGYCSWSHELKPVKGWTTMQERDGGFRVIDCPLFRKERK